MSRMKYDFTLNREIPLINPFKYMRSMNFDILGINLSNGEEIEMRSLTLKCVELLVIITSQNTTKEEADQYQNILEHNSKINEEDTTQIKEEVLFKITPQIRADLLQNVYSFVNSYDSEYGLSMQDKFVGISLYSALSIMHEQINSFSELTKYQKQAYLSGESNLQFVVMCESVMKNIEEVFSLYASTHNPDLKQPVEKLLNGGQVETFAGNA